MNSSRTRPSFALGYNPEDDCLFATITKSDGEKCVLRPDELYRLVVLGERIMMYFPSVGGRVALLDLFGGNTPSKLEESIPDIIRLNKRFVRD